MDRVKVMINGEESAVYRTTSDTYGNPRYIVHYLAIGLDDWESTPKTRSAGLKKYRGKSFGGGFVFQSYNVQDSIDRIMKILKGDE